MKHIKIGPWAKFLIIVSMLFQILVEVLVVIFMISPMYVIEYKLFNIPVVTETLNLFDEIQYGLDDMGDSYEKLKIEIMESPEYILANKKEKAEWNGELGKYEDMLSLYKKFFEKARSIFLLCVFCILDAIVLYFFYQMYENSIIIQYLIPILLVIDLIWINNKSFIALNISYHFYLLSKNIIKEYHNKIFIEPNDICT